MNNHELPHLDNEVGRENDGQDLRPRIDIDPEMHERLADGPSNFDFGESWINQSPEMTDAERCQEFQGQNSLVVLPDYRSVYGPQVNDQLNGALQANFIKRNYIVGGQCNLERFDTSTGKPHQPEESLAIFKAKYPHLEVPSNLSPEEALDFISYNYRTQDEAAIAKNVLGENIGDLEQAIDKAEYSNTLRLIEPVPGHKTAKNTVIRHVDELRLNDREEESGERQTSNAERAMFSVADVATSLVLKKYDAECGLIPIDRLRVVKQLDNEAGGKYRYDQLDILIADAKNDVTFLYRAAHEQIHFKAGAYIKFNPEENIWALNSLGLKVGQLSEDDKYFNSLNEAVTEELAIRALREIEHSGLDSLSAQIRVGLAKEPDSWMQSATNSDHGYATECWALQRIIDKIYALNSDKYASKEEVFDVFARAYLTGRVLDLARLVERSFGKGSYRQLGSADKGIEFADVSFELGHQQIQAKLDELLLEEQRLLIEHDGESDSELEELNKQIAHLAGLIR